MRDLPEAEIVLAESRFSIGTRTSSKNSSAVSEAFMPIFFSRLPRRKPGVSPSTTIRLTPFEPSSGAVLATTMMGRH